MAVPLSLRSALLLTLIVAACSASPPADSEPPTVVAPPVVEPATTFEPATDEAPEPAATTESTHATVPAANKWFSAMIGADVDGALALSGVPFSFDRKKLLATEEELREKYQQNAENKGKRELVADSIVLATLTAEELTRHYIGKDAVDVVRLQIGGETIWIFVRGSDGRIVGFSD